MPLAELEGARPSAIDSSTSQVPLLGDTPLRGRDAHPKPPSAPPVPRAPRTRQQLRRSVAKTETGPLQGAASLIRLNWSC